MGNQGGITEGAGVIMHEVTREENECEGEKVGRSGYTCGSKNPPSENTSEIAKRKPKMSELFQKAGCVLMGDEVGGDGCWPRS